MEENQTQRIPSFTVLKNGSILKNIILLNKSSSSSQNQEDEQILLVGRHPHCNITLGHPSISRYHLRIHSNPKSHSISVIDLSSVHGTWVCGMRVKPGVYVRLKEGDTVKIGGSSRVYELHWVPVDTLNEPYDVCAIKEGEEGANQDEIDDACSLDDDDMEGLEWPLEDKVQDSPFKKLDPLICSVSEYLSSSGDDTEVEHLSSSNEGNKNGQVFSAVLDQPESVVVQTVSAIHDFNSMSELSNEFEPQNDGVTKEDPVSELVVNCSKSSCDDTDVEQSSPWGKGHEIADIFAPVLVQSPLVVSEGLSETEVSDSLNKSEDQLNWLRENVSNEFELQNHGIIKEEPFSVLNCSKSPCYDAEEEHSSPKKTGNINGELFTAASIQSPFVVSEAIPEAEVFDSLDKSEDESNWLRDNISNEFEQLGYGTMKEDLITVAVFDALNQDIARSDEIDIGNEIENINEQEIDNWLRDNISNEFEQLSNGTVKDDMVSVALSEDIKTGEKDASDKEIARNNEIYMGNENEPLIQQEIDNGCVKGNDDGSFTPSREGGKEVNVGCVFEQMNQIKTIDESAYVILFDGLDNEVDISNEFGQLSHSAMKDDLLTVVPFDVVETYEKDVLNEDAARSDEIEMGNQSESVIQQEIDNGSISVALNNDVKGDEEEPFVADMAGAEEVNLGSEFEQMNQMKIMDENNGDEEEPSVILFDVVDSEINMGIKFELIDDEIMKKKSVFEALPDGTDSDQKLTLTPVSRVKEVCMNREAMMNGSVLTNLFDSLNENDTELFTPDKENKNPEARSGKSLLKRWKKAVSPIVNEEKDIFGFSKSLLTSVDESKNVLTRDEGEFVSTTLQQRLVDKFDPQEQNKEKNTGGDAEEARDFPTIVETIFTVPPHIWNLILSSLDPIEVANLRCSSRGLRCMLNGDEFIGRFNSIHQVGPTWNYLHVQTSEGPGSLVGFRWSDQTTLRTDLQGFFNIDEIIHTDTLTLLCSARSFFLFSRIRAGEEPILFVLNITKRSSVAINCPPPMNEFRFAWRRADIKLVVRDSENELNFEIVACVLARPRKIHICVYDSMVKDWVILQEAAECSNGVLVQENDPRSMFLVNIPFGDAYFVTMQEVGPICIQNMVFQTYFTSNISFAPELLETEDRWGIRISKHFTNQGWAATMFAHVYLKDDRRMIIRDLKLYKMTPQLEVYEQRAVLDPDHLEEAGEILVMPGAITLEATHEVVQLGMVVLVGQDLWRLKYFTFYINSGKWTVSNLPPFAAIRVGGPVLTSGLTL